MVDNARRAARHAFAATARSVRQQFFARRRTMREREDRQVSITAELWREEANFVAGANEWRASQKNAAVKSAHEPSCYVGV